jgi:hypothetical protein
MTSFLPGDRRLSAYKARGDLSFAGVSCSFRPALCVTPPLLFHNLLFSLVWISDLISMASTYCQQIAHNCPHNSIVKLGFQFRKPPKRSDASVFGCAARFNLSATDTPASMDDLRSPAPLAVRQGLPSTRTASPSENGEFFNPDDDDLPALTEMLARPKQVIDLTLYADDDDDDNDDDREGGDDDNFTEVSWLRELDRLDVA